MLKVKVKVKSNIQGYIKSLGLLPRGKVQTFIDLEVTRLSDSRVPSDLGFLRKSVFEKSHFGTGEIVYSIYGNPHGRNTWNDTASKFQDAPKRGTFWVMRMFNQGAEKSLCKD